MKVFFHWVNRKGENMKVKDLIEKLEDCNQYADVNVVAHCKPYDFSLACGNSEGSNWLNADEISFYVDELCTNEQTQ